MALQGAPHVYDINRLRAKQLGCEADHSHPLRSEVKEEWSYTVTLPSCLYDV
jgi:hypothetical protein